MIQSTFIHLPGVGEVTEKSLWSQGIHTWDDLELSAEEIFSPKKAKKCLIALDESRAAFSDGELAYFQQRMGSAHTWRLLPHCGEEIAFLDIETTGLGFPPESESTTVAVSFGGELKVEYDPDKKRQLFERLNDEARMWVTFNGQCFDLPFLRQEFEFPFSQPHIDLRVWLKRLGYSGGLKRIQNQVAGIPKRTAMDIDGFDAVRLWRMHLKGLSGALETLMTYNAEDTVVLEYLLHHAWELQRELQVAQCPSIKIASRERPSPPEIHTQIHSHVYDLLRGEAHWQLPSDW